MTTLTSYGNLTLFPTPTVGLLLRALTEEPGSDALAAYEADHALRAGYVRGPRGEWMTAAPAVRR